MGTPRKRTIAVAAGVSAALLASSTAFAVANGILGARPSDRVGTFGMIEQRLVPAEAPVRKTVKQSAPPRVTTTAPAIVAPTATAHMSGEGADSHAAAPSAVVAPAEPGAQSQPETEHESGPKPTIVAPKGATPTTHTTASTTPHGDDANTKPTAKRRDD